MRIIIITVGLISSDYLGKLISEDCDEDKYGEKLDVT
ncbi:hypothetical protein Tco_0890064, partial [Tanacetum coccineum]